MRLLSCLALVISSTLLPAQDFDFKGVPADYAVTFATASTRGLKISDSSEAKAFKERLEKLVAEFDKSGQDGKAVQAAIKNATGFDLESGDNRFTGGFSVTQAGAFNGGLIIRGRHDSAKLAAHAAGKNVPSLRAGATKGWKAQELIASLSEDLAQAANNFPTPPQGEAPGSEDVGVITIPWSWPSPRKPLASSDCSRAKAPHSPCRRRSAPQPLRPAVLTPSSRSMPRSCRPRLS
jgi:hypothetical protein